MIPGNRLSRIVLTACLLAAGGCSRGPAGPDPIRPQEDSCAACRMQISQPRYAGEVLTAEGEYLKFDDLGCLRSFLKEHPAFRNAPCWVADRETGAWLEARSASFALEAGESTPMNSRVLAFRSPERAQGKGARVVTFEDFLR